MASWTTKQKQDAPREFQIYSLTKDDIRRRRLVKDQVMIFESLSMPGACDGMRTKQRHYGRNKTVTPVVY